MRRFAEPKRLNVSSHAVRARSLRFGSDACKVCELWIVMPPSGTAQVTMLSFGTFRRRGSQWLPATYFIVPFAAEAPLRGIHMWRREWKADGRKRIGEKSPSRCHKVAERFRGGLTIMLSKDSEQGPAKAAARSRERRKTRVSSKSGKRDAG